MQYSGFSPFRDALDYTEEVIGRIKLLGDKLLVEAGFLDSSDEDERFPESRPMSTMYL